MSQKWEYMQMLLTTPDDDDEHNDDLDEAGADGWELVAVQAGGVDVYTFKRPVVDEPTPPERDPSDSEPGTIERGVL